MTSLTLADIRQLCDLYVPLESRHPNSLDPLEPGDDLWWHAHEIGHLLTVEPAGIGKPLFGLDPSPETARDEHQSRCRELAAMSVSSRLLTSAGHPDLAVMEREATDYGTRYYEDRGSVRRILRKHRCLRVPATRAGLERKLRSVVDQSHVASIVRGRRCVTAEIKRKIEAAKERERCTVVLDQDADDLPPWGSK